MTGGADFWRSAGLHLVERDERGWLRVTPDLIRAYLTRPEVHPVEESDEAEHRLFEALMADPFRAVARGEIAAMGDHDAHEAYEIVLRFRDHLARHGTVEGSYLGLLAHPPGPVPPVFVDQMAHLILRNALSGTGDPVRVRAAELFFREQSVSTDGGQIMLADAEIIEQKVESAGASGLDALLVQGGLAPRAATIDVLTEETAPSYWSRSDRFDTALDFRFAEPAQDGFARVVEAWVDHLLGLKTRVQPMQSIRDERWSWHIGLDAEATRILNGLYKGEEDVGAERIVALFRMELLDRERVVEALRGKPVYLGLAMTPGGRVRMKPQNLLVNLPLREGD